MNYDDFVITDEQAEKIAISVFNDICLFAKERKENTQDDETKNKERKVNNEIH